MDNGQMLISRCKCGGIMLGVIIGSRTFRDNGKDIDAHVTVGYQLEILPVENGNVQIKESGWGCKCPAPEPLQPTLF